MRRMISLMLSALMVFPMAVMLCACSEKSKSDAGYEQISQAVAKKYIDTDLDIIILDTRTEDEFAQGHIPGAMLIPYDEIPHRAAAELPDKDKLILVYCRSGRRSKIAAQSLADMGYTNVKEFGGIIDWEYEVTQ